MLFVFPQHAFCTSNRLLGGPATRQRIPQLSGGQPEWGGCDLTPTIHWVLYNLFLPVANIPFVMFSNSFLWKQLRFLKKA